MTKIIFDPRYKALKSTKDKQRVQLTYERKHDRNHGSQNWLQVMGCLGDMSTASPLQAFEDYKNSAEDREAAARNRKRELEQESFTKVLREHPKIDSRTRLREVICGQRSFIQ